MTKLTKWSIIEDIKIDKIWYEGVGVSTYTDGRKIIVSWWVLPGTLADLRVVQLKRDWIKCHIYKIKEIKNELITSEKICHHYLFNPDSEQLPVHKRNCWGCKWQILDYENQLVLKKQIVEDSFRHNKNNPINIKHPLSSPQIRWYRNKIEYSFGKYITWKKENLQRLSDRSLGFHKQGDFGKIVDIDECLLVDEKVNQLFSYIKNLLENYKKEDNQTLEVYDQRTHKWVLRHLMIRQWKNTDQIMVILSLSDQQISQVTLQKLKSDLKEDLFLSKYIDTWVMIYNNGLADVVSNQDSVLETLWWSGKIEEILYIKTKEDNIPIKFEISPKSFFQTNTNGANLLYNTAIDITRKYLEEKYDDIFKDSLILDLYCWAGSIGISFLSAWIWSQLIGIEEAPSAIADARKNIVNNNISNTEFFVWKIEKIINIADIWWKTMIQVWDKKFDLNLLKLIIVDPPRSWLHPDVISYLDSLKEKIDFTLLYISCNPVTLSRDLWMFNNFQREGIQPIDMFPHTYHIENIVLLK